MFKYIILLLLAFFGGFSEGDSVKIDQRNISNINSVIQKVSVNGGGIVEIENGTYYDVPPIILKSNITLIIRGTLYMRYSGLVINRTENVAIVGKKNASIVSSSSNATAKGIVVSSAKNCEI